jgi:uncharacterized membrane protein
MHHLITSARAFRNIPPRAKYRVTKKYRQRTVLFAPSALELLAGCFFLLLAGDRAFFAFRLPITSGAYMTAKP